jgi:hypothetical protein
MRVVTRQEFIENAGKQASPISFRAFPDSKINENLRETNLG